MNRLNASQVDIGYRNTTIIKELDVQICDGKITSIIDRTVVGNLHY